MSTLDSERVMSAPSALDSKPFDIEMEPGARPSMDDAAPETAGQSPLEKLKTNVVYVVLLCGVTSSGMAVAIFTKGVTIAMAVVCMLIAPRAVYNEIQLAKLPTIRYLNNKMRDEVNELTEQVDTLAEEIDVLKPEADRLAQSEDDLEALLKDQGANVETLVELMKENKIIQTKMRNHLREIIVQDIIGIVVESDRDNDQTIDKKEAMMMSLKIDLQLKEQGIRFDQEKFLKIIGGSTAVHAIIGITRKLLPSTEEDEAGGADDDDDSDDEDDPYDMFHTAENDGKTQMMGAGGGVSLVESDKGSRSRKMIRKVEKKRLNVGGAMKGTMV